MTFALPSSPHWAPTTTVTGMTLQDTVLPMAVMRRMTWAAMSERDRAALCERGLGDIFDPALRDSIGRIIDDVRVNGDQAVCRALRDFDRISISPEQLRGSADELESAAVSPDVDA